MLIVLAHSPLAANRPLLRALHCERESLSLERYGGSTSGVHVCEPRMPFVERLAEPEKFPSRAACAKSWSSSMSETTRARDSVA